MVLCEVSLKKEQAKPIICDKFEYPVVVEWKAS